MSTTQYLATFLEQPESFLESRSELYQPLDVSLSQMRLLHIQPAASNESELDLTIEIVSLENAPDFEAISYTWGTLQPVSQINLHGIPYNVTSSQYTALRRFRLPDKTRIMWMDIICIDQANSTERSSQVTIMDKIYTRSVQTQVWLGEIDPLWEKGLNDDEWTEFVDFCMSTSDVPRFIKGQNPDRWAELSTPFLKTVEDPGSLIQGALHILDLIVSDVHFDDMPYCLKTSDETIELSRPWYGAMRVVARILDRSWWTRLWVTQEALLSPRSPTLYLGDIVLQFDFIQAVASHYRKHAGSSNACCYKNRTATDHDAMVILTQILKIDMSRLFADKHVAGDWEIGRALILGRDLNATDARDHVYGLQGLVCESDRLPIDYTLDVPRLFSRATWQFYNSENSLNWLERGHNRIDSRSSDAPSWMIDWATEECLDFQYYTFFDKKDEPPNWDNITCDWRAGTLDVTVALVDKVKTRLDRIHEPSWTPGDNVAIINSWIKQLEDLGIFVGGDDCSEVKFSGVAPDTDFLAVVFRNTIVDYSSGNMVIRRLEQEDRLNLIGWYMELNENVECKYAGYNPRSEMLPHAIAFQNGVRDSTMCITEAGRLCMIPLSAMDGDCIYHVTSCAAPLILRPVSDDDSPRATLNNANTDAVDTDAADMEITTADNKDTAISTPPDAANTEATDTDTVDTATNTIPVDTVDTDAATTTRLDRFQIVGPCYAEDLMGSDAAYPEQERRIRLV